MDSTAPKPLPAAEIEELCRSASAGDEAALQRLLLHYHARLLGFLRRKVGVDWQGKIDPEDLLQEGYIKLFSSMKEFKPEGDDSFYRWASRVLDHTFIDQVRALRRQKRDVMREVSNGQAGATEARRSSLLEQALQHSVTPSRIMRREDALAAMMTCIAKLPEDYRVVVRRHYLNEESFKVIAADLGRTEDAIRRLAGRAVEQLGQCLGSASHFLSMRG